MAGTFADSFWAGNGYDVVEKQVSAGRESLDRASKVMHDLAVLESEYAKGLAKISKAAAPLSKEELSSVRTFWDTFRQELDTQAKIHGATGFAIDADVAKPLAAARDECAKQQKAIDKRYIAAEKAYNTAKATEQKSRKLYMSKAQDAEATTLNYERTAKSGPDKEAVRLEKVSSKLRKEADTAEKEFRTAVRQTHTTRMAYEEAFVSACLEYQALEHERLHVTKGVTAKYTTTCIEMQPSMVQSLEAVAAAATAIDAAADMVNFANGRQTGRDRAPEVFYQTFELDRNSVVDEGRRRDALQRQHADLVLEMEMERKELDSVQNLVKVYTDRPEFSNASTLAALQQHAATSSDYIVKLEALIAAYASMLSSVGGTPSSAGSAAGGLGSRASIAVSGTSAAAASSSSASPGRRSTVVASGPAGGSASGGGARQSVVGGGSRATKAAAPAGSIRGSIAVTQVVSAPTPAPAAGITPAKVQTCTILYDFEATGDGELSVKEGAVVPLLSMTDPDWWTIEVDGQIGYVPASYVQLDN